MSQRPGTYQNPVLPGFFPDPSVCRVGGDFYLVNSSFEYFPALPIHHSRDLVEWTPLGYALDRAEQLDFSHTPTSKGIYAPTLRHHNGVYYLICTDVDGIGNFILHATHPAGPWSQPVRVAIDGIDPSLFFHENRVWLTVSAPDQKGIWLAQIDPMTGALLSPVENVWIGTGGKYPEGPHLYMRNGWYYLLISEGGTEYGHMITVARSRAVTGPYEPCPHNPIFSHRSMDQTLQATGHADLVELENGSWWMVFLAIRPLGYPPMHHMGRETCLAPVGWEDDWPRVTCPLPLSLPRPDLLADGIPLTSVRDDFDKNTLAHCWNFRRAPLDNAWSLSRKKGHLSLRCATPNLDDMEPLAFLGRRLQHIRFRAETEVDFSPENEHESAGMAIQANERFHASLEITRVDGQRIVRVKRRAGRMQTTGDAHVLPAGPVCLRISTDDAAGNATDWNLQARLAAGWTTLDLVETRMLSTELVGGFTGTFLTLFASANGTQSDRWAAFDWFDYEPLPEHTSP